jgi:hypothetical protein
LYVVEQIAMVCQVAVGDWAEQLQREMMLRRVVQLGSIEM